MKIPQEMVQFYVAIPKKISVFMVDTISITILKIILMKLFLPDLKLMLLLQTMEK